MVHKCTLGLRWLDIGAVDAGVVAEERVDNSESTRAGRFEKRFVAVAFGAVDDVNFVGG